MKKRWLIVFAALAFGLLLVALISGWFEPRYGGMRANSYVFQELDTPNFGTAVAEVKIKPMGAKLALPALIKALAYEDSVMRLRYGRLHAQLPGALRKILPAPRSIQHLRRNAITVLGVFGLEARPAVPMLTQIYARADVFQRQSMAYALGALHCPQQPAQSRTPHARRARSLFPRTHQP